jgi:hypothetical protein
VFFVIALDLSLCLASYKHLATGKATHFRQAKMQEDFRAWIAKKGGAKLAQRLNLPENTVYSWSHRNVIPRTVWPDLILAYSETGLNDLLAMEAASDPAKPE